MSFTRLHTGACAQNGGGAGQMSCPNSLPNCFDPEWFSANVGPLFEEWLRTQYRGDAQLIARVFAVHPETVKNWLRQSSLPSSPPAVGAVIAFPPLRQHIERAYQQHLDRQDAAVIRAARQRQKARRGMEAA